MTRVPESQWPYSASEFDRSAINFASFEHEMSTVDQEFVHPLRTLKNLIVGASEYDFRINLWDPLITNLLRIAETSLGDVGYRRFSSEWETRALFPELDARRVDCVLLVSIQQQEIPILLVEMDKVPFGTGVNSHKDYSKLVGMMSLCCQKLAQELEDVGRKPEDARVYGACIGGTQIQFFVAQPRIISHSNNEYSIEVHVTSPAQWKFDILGSEELDIEPNDSYSSIPSEHLPIGLFDVTIEGTSNTVAEYTTSDFNSDIESEFVNLDVEVSGGYSEAVTDVVLDQSGRPQRLYQNNHLKSTLSMIKIFFMTVTARVNHLYSPNSMKTHLVIPRHFRSPGTSFIVGSRPSSEEQTPQRERLTETRPDNSASPSSRAALRTRGASTDNQSESDSSAEDSVEKCVDSDDSDDYVESEYSDDSDDDGKFYGPSQRITKHSRTEFNLYKEYLCALPSFFPKFYYARQDKTDPEVFHYCFEFLRHIYYENGEISAYLQYPSCRKGLFIAIKFALNLLCSLQILHDWFGYVHSDISPGNVMFCDFLMTWKLNDFNQSLPIEESEKTSRFAGTKNYIAPESLKTGIFTFESDIWSLGRVIYDTLVLDLLCIVESNRSSTDPLTISSLRDFERIIISMMSSNPSNRPTARTAIKKIFPILDRFEDSYDPNSPVFKRIIYLCTEVESSGQNTPPLPLIDDESVKKAKIDTL